MRVPLKRSERKGRAKVREFKKELVAMGLANTLQGLMPPKKKGLVFEHAWDGQGNELRGCRKINQDEPRKKKERWKPGQQF